MAIKAEQYGRSKGGFYFNDVDAITSDIIGIHSIEVKAGGSVDSIQANYLLADGSTYAAPRHGGRGGHPNSFTLDADEHIFKVEGNVGGVIDQLTFYTINKAGQQRKHGPYGNEYHAGTRFTHEGHIISFYGRAGNLLDCIGFYHQP